MVKLNKWKVLNSFIKNKSPCKTLWIAGTARSSQSAAKYYRNIIKVQRLVYGVSASNVGDSKIPRAQGTSKEVMI